MTATIQARGVTFSYGPNPVLHDVDFAVGPGQRFGVVGPNGTGKSTLLRVLAGHLRPERGTVRVAPADATVGLLPQEPDRDPEESVVAFVGRRTGVAAAEAELDGATEALAAGEPDGGDRYAVALDRWLALGGPDLDARLGEVLADLGIDGAVAEQATDGLSGGQAARVSLAATLLSRFDVLLLDEPTNDLDFDGLARLEAFVLSRSEPVVVVSHDRAFLERVVTHVVELDEHDHTATVFGGGWHAYLDARATARRHAEEDHAAYVAKRDELRSRAQHQREWSSQGIGKAKRSGETDKFVRHRAKSQSEQLAGKARATERAIDRLEVVDKPWEGWELRFEIGTAERSGDVVAELHGAVAERGSFRLGPVDLVVGWADRIAIEGENGAGKSTLIDLLLGRLDPVEGTATIGPSVVVGELSQRRERFAGDPTVLEVVQDATGGRVDEVRSLLAKFGLGAEHVGRPSSGLSPGERTRANLALFMAEGVNLLVLDEPTNHLDLPAIEQLEQALGRFVGTLLLVTHDRAFLDRVDVTRRLVVAGGRVVEH
ncbi:MAG: ABC-F family ATP-binding cassette domain-containing protein [Actinobacteria bacterium]|nr:ABC-F family ATP-binding cassette domain-containing protein [Actinomycetota bacterium]